MIAVENPWELPSRPWNPRPIARIDELTEEERADIERAGVVYIFGNSQLVAGYREIIEFCYAPFEAAVYVARKVTIHAGASLVVTGMPALLRFSELEIHPEGRLITYVACNGSFELIHKL
jgi:acetyltransferase-like isoleucine patch superfamily enzyme